MRVNNFIFLIFKDFLYKHFQYIYIHDNVINKYTDIRIRCLEKKSNVINVMAKAKKKTAQAANNSLNKVLQFLTAW